MARLDQGHSRSAMAHDDAKGAAPPQVLRGDHDGIEDGQPTTDRHHLGGRRGCRQSAARSRLTGTRPRASTRPGSQVGQGLRWAGKGPRSGSKRATRTSSSSTSLERVPGAVVLYSARSRESNRAPVVLYTVIGGAGETAISTSTACATEKGPPGRGASRRSRFATSDRTRSVMGSWRSRTMRSWSSRAMGQPSGRSSSTST